MLEVCDHLALGQHTLPFIGRANLWIDDSVFDKASVELVRSLIGLAIANTEPGQLEVAVFDDALSGIGAPFEALNSGGEQLLQSTHELRELTQLLAHLREHIHAVNGVMQGRTGSLIDYRRSIAYPVERYKLIVLAVDAATLPEDLQTQLATLLKAGPRCGVTFLVHSSPMGVEFLANLCDHYTVRGGQLSVSGEVVTSSYPKLSTSQLISISTDASAALATTAMRPIAFTAIQSTDFLWNSSSTNGVTFSIGQYGDRIVELTLGDELNQRHNMLVTGAVGQGKSNLLAVIIHSICQRYSPSEVELYLLDFKEGITLQPYATGPSGSYLPHARVLALDADREFGLKTLEHLYDVYLERMKEFKDAGVQNIREYRNRFSQRRMPRLILMIDEFQMMFTTSDRFSERIANLLVRSIRLFRAAGIHVVLASQTIGGNMALLGSAGDGLFGQVPIRVALKNSLTESLATLGPSNPAASHLHAREAIVNVDYGAPQSNRKTTIAFADERVLAPLRMRWWKEGRDLVSRPYVFIGDHRRSLADDANQLTDEEANTHQHIFLGGRIGVDAGAMALRFDHEIGRNLAVIGAGDGSTLLLNAALSLAYQHRSRGCAIVILNMRDQDSHAGLIPAKFTQSLSDLNCELTIVEAAQVTQYIEALGQRIPDITSPLTQATYLVGLGLERCRRMPTEFQEICRFGPRLGIHCLMWWTKLDSFREHVGYGGESQFDIRVALKQDSQSVKVLMNDPLLDWRHSSNRALVWDSSELFEPEAIVPYSTIETDFLRK